MSDPIPDERVRRALEAEDFEYTINSYGQFRVVLRFTDDDRTQLTLISSKTTTFRDREWRKVWSIAYEIMGQISLDQAASLLADSDNHVFGAWGIEVESDNKTIVYFQVAVPADATPKELHHAISLVSSVADEKEKSRLGTDYH